MQGASSSAQGLNRQEELKHQVLKVQLYDALKKGFEENCKKILEQLPVDSSLNSLGVTALHMAACNGSESLFKLVLAHGPNINVRDGMGRTPLHAAVANEHVGIITMLLAHPAILVDSQSLGGETPLMRAIVFGRRESVRMLLQAGASLSIKNNGGQTALDILRQNPSSNLLDLFTLEKDEDGNVQMKD
mmetsp:Transcript_37784/g.27835  ORF Transcript_37784/g.27835 Transcript_37784/m.27835 type:complete len:189 (+) Transcript_37784:30-596(+)